jgi:hypothetical protein
MRYIAVARLQGIGTDLSALRLNCNFSESSFRSSWGVDHQGVPLCEGVHTAGAWEPELL